MTPEGGPDDAAGIVGREGEALSGLEFLARIGVGGPTALMIEGEQGIGKTVLLDRIARLGAHRGMRILEARPDQSETAISYAGLGDLMEGVDAAGFASLPAPQARALEVACLRREPVAPEEDQRLIGTALAGLLRQMAAVRPVLIVVDDAQWLDGPTTRALAFALRRVAGARLGVLLSRRHQDPGPAPFGLATLPASQLEAIELGALDVGDIHSLVESRMAVPMSRQHAARLHRLTSGNPYFALEVARVVRSSTDEAGFWEGVAANLDMDGLSRDRLRAMPAPTGRILAAVAGSADPRATELARALGPKSTFEARLRPALDAGVVIVAGDRIRFAHPLLAAAAYALQPASEQRAIHRALARVAGDPEQRARHLSLGHDRPDAAVAEAVDAGARRAAERGAPDAAAELGAAALDLTPAPATADRRRRSLELAGHLARSGDLASARRRYDEVLVDLGPGPERAAVLRRLAELCLLVDDFVEAIALLEDATAQAGLHPGIRLPLDLLLTYALVNRLRPLEARTHSVRALADAEAIGVPHAIATALAVEQMSAVIVGVRFDEASLDRAIALEDPEPPGPAVMRPRLVAAVVLGWRGSHRRARELLEGVEQDVITHGDEASLPHVLVYLSIVLISGGDIAAAALAADRAFSVADALDSTALRAIALTARARVAALRGEDGAAEQHLDRADRLYDQVGWLSGRLWTGSIRGSLAWARGDAAEAIEILEPMHTAYQARGYADEVVTPYSLDLIEAFIAVGRNDAAQELVATTSTWGIRADWPWARAMAATGSALLLARAGRHAEALLSMDEGEAELGLLDPSPYDEARLALVRGRLERRAKRRAAAAASLDRALAGFTGLGATHWIATTRTEIARLGGSPVTQLTATEAQVAALAARGLTNREVAELAFVTPKSVEGILSRAYAKLGIHSRAELGAWAARLPDVPESAE